MRKEIEVFIELSEGAVMPTYANEGDAGMDVYALEDIIIPPMDTKIIPTGIKVAVPDGYEIQVRPRSGISYKTPLRISNSPGTVDAKYRGDVGVIITNTSVPEKNILQLEEYLIDEKGNKQGTYKIRKGDRIAQIVLQEVPKIKFNKIDNIKDIEGDRNGGFGSTGI